ncbi:PDR/VanB family oxidoreductase [Hydrogenophaga sp. SNF1]|uniref:PDR/VanB family oxidoreductase n=1 Tax=Hydrogenophaga sp. SNF1 TaxID=3098762 RepID=UPI002ACC37D7|nr:PDR/VanB family oxidoreductase [Hydrogenophaga sp. SNF1]WQB83319.1 PDR/VanB family oxidoreductase [Hydrogenophaga sp. SNF1]
MQALRLRVARKSREAAGVAAFELRSLDGSALPPFTAGAHVDVLLREGLVRQYSLCNAPWERDRYVLGVQRKVDSRGGSVAMHDEVHEGAIVDIGLPRNLFSMAPAKRSLLFGAGIGITPLLSMAEVLHASGRAFELHYSARSPEQAAFRARLAAAAYADRVRFHFSTGPGANRLELPPLLATPDPEARLYVCGPPGYIGDITDFAAAHGWRADQVCVERFGATTASSGGDRAFDVVLARSGRRFTIAPGQAIHEVLLSEGVEVPLSCEQGVCGTCLTRVLSGVPDHRDSFLDASEHARNDCMTVCCSRATSPELLLDL